MRDEKKAAVYMILSDFENIIALFGTVVGLLLCLFKYIESPKRGYLYLIIFFLAHFFSDYYWTVYRLVMHSDPEVSGLVAYLGWNTGYIFLFLAVLHMCREGAKRFFHPLILWPVLTNCLQFVLYIQFGGILNNVWMVGWSTLTMVLCMQDILYYAVNRKRNTGEAQQFPHLSLLVLLFLSMGYVMWTASCFDWNGELLNPYFYGSVLSSLCGMFFARGAGKFYQSSESAESSKSEMELKFQTLIQAIVCLVVFFGCVGGYILAVWIKNSLPVADNGSETSGIIITMLFSISFVFILVILFLLHEIASRYRIAQKSLQEMDEGRLGRYNLIFTITVTLGLMLFAVIFNFRALYSSSVTALYEDGKEEVSMTAIDLENYLAVAETTLRVTADNIDLMDQSGASTQEIYQYLLDQTARISKQFDENFTGLYAYINGTYLDGLGWDPPSGYDPVSRDWYHAALEANGNVAIVPPYVDAQTGSIVITFARSISSQNVVCLDVMVNHIQEIAEQVDIAGRGYGMVVGADGLLIAHRNTDLNGRKISELYAPALLNQIVAAGNGTFSTVMDGERCTLFVHPILKQWYAVIVVRNAEFFEKVYIRTRGPTARKWKK